ncbi:MAG: hypothetical protein KGO50_18135 [Myxococcales bacterium]|nr:hypothetical protein [Myxococcales bacterium]
MSRHRKKHDLEEMIRLAAATGRYLHLPAGVWVASRDDLADSPVQVSVQVDTSAGQPWRWMDAARDAFSSVRATTNLPIELWLTTGGIDALCVLALQPEALSVPVCPATLTSDAAESLLRSFRQFEVVPVLRVGAELPAMDTPLLLAMKAYAAPCWIHVDAPPFQDHATRSAVTSSIWPLVRMQRNALQSNDGGVTSSDSLVISELCESVSPRTVESHRLLLGCTDVREPCG